MVTTPTNPVGAKKRGKPRGLLTPALVGMAVVVTLAAYLYWEQARQVETLPQPRFDSRALQRSMPGVGAPGELSPGANDSAEGAALDRVQAMADPQAMLRQWPGDRVLDAREATLPPPARGRDWMGLLRTGGGEGEEMSFCTVDAADAGAARAHYRALAESLGFERVGGSDATPQSPVSVDLYGRTAVPPRSPPGSPPSPQTLLVRLGERGGTVRVMAWLRYAMPVTP